MTLDSAGGALSDPPRRNLPSSEKFFDEISFGVLVQDSAGLVIEANSAAANIIGVARDELTGRAVDDPRWDSVHFDGTPFALEELPFSITLRTHEPCVDVLMGTENWLQARRWILVNTSMMTLIDGRECVVSSFTDVSDRYRARLLVELLIGVNRAVVNSTDVDSCLQGICDAIVFSGLYRLAWIGVASVATGGVDVLCGAGAVDYLHDNVPTWWGSSPSGMGPVGRALRTGEVHMALDLPQHAVVPEWREGAQRFGLGSAIAIPFTLNGQRAAIAIYNRDLFWFDDDVAADLSAMAEEITFGLGHLKSILQTQAALRQVSETNLALEQAQEELSETSQRFALAFEENISPMLVIDLEDQVLTANKAFCELTGYAESDILRQNRALYTHPDDIRLSEEVNRRLLSGEADRWRYAKRYVRSDGRVAEIEATRYAARDAHGRMLYSIMSAKDVTEEKKLHRELSHQALHDVLTGLPNRVLFQDRLQTALEVSARAGGVGAVLHLDLKNFKRINDLHGHFVGDQVLVEVARRLAAVARPLDTLSHGAADEFLYLAEGLNDVVKCDDVANVLLGALDRVIVVEATEFELSARVGIVKWSANDRDADMLLQQADSALHEAKLQSHSPIAIFDQRIQLQVETKYSLVNELRTALRSGGLEMHYQPILDLATSRLVGLEALMRWNHPTRGWIPPVVFIPLAEDNQLIGELGEFAVRCATQAAASWPVDPVLGKAPYVSVNASAYQLREPGLAAMVRVHLTTSGLEASRLLIEITESVTLFDVAESLQTILQLNELGVGIALDDFGTGYSSLSYLVRLNPRIIKIDRSFVNPPEVDHKNALLLEAIVSLGHKLGIAMVAEGIETPKQFDDLAALGCQFGQGFHFSPAMIPESVARFVKSNWKKTARHSR